MDWYHFALIALCSYSLQGILLKYAADKKCDKNLITFFCLLTVSVLSLLLTLFYGISDITTIGLIAAVINGVFYSVDIITRVEALKYIPASIVYPVVRLSNAVIVILLILFLGESLTLQIFLGIVLSVISIYLLSQGEKNEKRI